MTEKSARGIVIVYTGDGKGKTTSALGVALRAVGHGMTVIFIQFVKGETVGEHLFASKQHFFQVIQVSTGSSFTKNAEELEKEARETLACAEEKIACGQYDIVILDEVFVAISKGLITVGQVIDLIRNKPDSVNLVLTGRNAPGEVMELADLVTQMKNIKHPFQKSVGARRGIDY
ncbi:cob(I)yrinic acid a,c-diamide adenosyltransferase [Chloroflexota bacterium]